MADRLILDGTGGARTVAAGNDFDITGTAAEETIVVQDGGIASFASGTGDRIDVQGNLADFTVSSSGNQLILTDAEGSSITVNLNAETTIGFSDGSTTAQVAAGDDGPAVQLGGQAADDTFDPANVTLDEADASPLPADGGGGGSTPPPTDGQTFTLTTGVDLQQDFTGGSGDDVFIADDSGDDVVGPADELFGEGGDDILRIFESGGTLPGTVDSIESLQLNLTPDNTDLDLSGLSDVTSVELVQDGGSNAYTIGDGQSVTIRNTTIENAANALELNYSTTPTSATVTLDGVTSAGTSAELEIDGDSLTSAAITSANNASTVDALNTGGSASLATLTIDGDAALEITDDLNDNIATVDASGNSGGVDVSVGNVDTTAGSGLSVTGSSADDDLNVGGGAATTLNDADASLTAEAGTGDDTVNVENLLNVVNADATFTISGGEGEDTLVVSATFANGIEASDVGDFEVIELAGAGGYDLEGFGFNSVVASVDLTANTLTVDEGVSVELTAGQADLTIDQVGAGSAGSLDDSLDLTLNPGADATQTKLTADNIETINLTSTSSADDPSTVTNTITDFEADGLGTLNISGDSNLTFTNALTDPVDLVNAGDLSGDLNLDISGQTNAAAVTAGSGNDVLTSSGRSDVIDAGAGDDQINVDADAAGTTDTVTVSVTTGAGEDTVDHSVTQGLLRSTVDDFSFGNDELATDDGQLDGSGITNATQAASFVNDALGAGTAAAADIEFLQAGATGTPDTSAVFEFDGSTHVVGSTNQAFDSDGDVFITLQGVTGLEAGDVADLFA